MELGLDGKVVLITGGTAGIGRAAAHAFLAEGASVAVCGRDPDRADAAAEQMGGGTIGVAADIGDPEDLERLVTTTQRHLGPIDVLVNNAGGGARAHPFEITDEAWQQDLELKLLAHVRLARMVAPGMQARGGGAIVNVSSIHARHPGPSSVPTSASRAAGLAFAKSLSHDLGPHNVRVNTVCIGVVKGGGHDRRLAALDEPVDRETFYRDLAADRGVPLGRTGEVEEAAAAIVFLASDAASYITGVDLAVDGGASHVS